MNNPIGDRNVERLVGTAYKPEVPDPAFVHNVEEHLLFTAHQLAEARPESKATRLLPARPIHRGLAWTMGMAAAIAIVALVWYARTPRLALPQEIPIDPPGFMVQNHEPVPAVPSVIPWQGHDLAQGMTPRPRPVADPVKAMEVGKTLATKAGERRRVVLADGSILYLNQNTEVKQIAPRRLDLSKGEVYVEVAPREAGDEPSFVVSTPRRQVSALGTRFGVQADADDTGVVVTQGKVQVSGVDQVIEAGQQLTPGGQTIIPAARATHLLDWTRELMAAAESPLVPASKHCGGALVAFDPNGQEVNLTLRKFLVDVHIEDGFARTTIDQTYFNNLHSDTEGVFYFPLPPDATLSRLAMYVVDGSSCRLMEGGMAEREHARTVFETIRHTNRDPALLEWVDGSTFKMRVFPLESRREKRVILSYTQRLSSLYGIERYRFPAGHNMALVQDWAFQTTIKNGAKARITSPSHPDMKIKPDGVDLQAKVAARNIKPNQDVTLEIVASGGRKPPDGKSDEIRGLTSPARQDMARFSSVLHEGNQYLMVRYRPSLTSMPKRERRDWVFLFESGSNRDPLLARAQVDIIRTLLDNAGHDDTFAILTAGTRVRQFDKAVRKVSAKNVEEAVKFLEATHLVGSLDLDQALRATLPFLKAQNPHLVHVGAGVPAMGERRDDVLAKLVPENTRYVGIGVGKRWNRAFMKLAADRSGGYFTQINPDETISWRAFELLATLNTPRLLELRVVDNAERVTFLSDTASLAQGEEVCAVTKISGRAGDANPPVLPAKITISGKVDGKPFVKELPVANIAHNAGYLPRQWAKLELDRLLAEDSDKHKKTIIELSKAMYVMAPFTSLLVLEREADYQRFGVDRGRKDHWAMYSCPEQIPIVHQPDTRWTAPKVDPANKGKPSEVLQTILVRIPPPVLASQANAGSAPAVNALQIYSGAYAMPVFVPDGGTVYMGGFGVEIGMQSPMLTSEKIGQVFIVGNEVTQDRVIRRLSSLYPGQILTMGKSLEFTLESQLKRTTISPFLQPQGAANPDAFGSSDRVRIMALNPAISGLTPAGTFTPDLGIPGQPTFGGWPGGGPGFGPGNIDWGAYYKNHGYQITTGGGGMPLFGGNGRIQYAPVFVSPQMQWAVPKTTVMGPPGVMPSGTTTSAPWGEFRTGSIPVNLPGTGSGLLPRTTIHPVVVTTTKMVTVTPTSPQANLDAPQGPRVPSLESPLPLIRPGGGDKSPLKDKATKKEAPVLEAEIIAERLLRGFGQRSVLYQRPTYNGDHRLFGDLAIYAPGMNTNDADIHAVLEAESARTKGSPGAVDPAAKILIDKARASGWQVLTFRTSDQQAELKFHVNGAGQYAFERILANGLRERVVCDGSTLLHLYPEIGLGARRTVSRFHRAELANLVPWYLPPIEDLARGADVKKISDNTVSIIPLDSGRAEGVSPPVQLHLVFDKTGRLSERRWLAAQKIVYRESYDPQGTVKYHGQETVTHKISVSSAKAPNLKPDTSKLVLVPLPLRTREHLYGQLKNWTGSYADLDADVVISLIAADCLQFQGQQALQAFGQRFHAKGDKRIGFYTLLAGSQMSIQQGVSHRWGQADVKFNILLEHFGNPLAKYLGHYNQALSTNDHANLGDMPGPKEGFMQRLGEFYDLFMGWHYGRTPKRADQRDEALAYVQKCQSPLFAWMLLDVVQRQGQGTSADFQRIAAETHKRFGHSGLVYAVRYEHARSILQAGQREQALKLFNDLYLETLQAGDLPTIDVSLVGAFKGSEGDAKFGTMIRQTASKFLKENNPQASLLLAWQLWQLNEQALADEVFNQVQGASKNQGLLLTSLEYLWQTSQWARADMVLQKLLADENLARQPSLWRLGAALAQKRNLVGRQVAYLEKAMDQEFRQLPEAVNLQTVRQDYGSLLQQYQQLAVAVTMLEADPPKEFLVRVIRAADRWRLLDPDGTAACQQAAKILQTLGARDLAWDYLTTPIGLKPNEAAPWVSLANTLRTDADFDLADRAYAMAFQAEPTNAQILWDRAQNLQQLGRGEQARQLFRQLAESSWQPRFQGLQNQARGYLNQN